MTERIEGLSIGLDLNSIGVDNGLKSLKGKIALVNSEMKANLSAFDRSEKSMQKYETQLTGLNKKLEVQKLSVKAAKDEYDEMVKRHGASSKEADKAAEVYNKQTASFKGLEKYIEKVTKEMKNFDEQQKIASSNWTKFGDKLDKTGKKFTAVGDGMKTAGAGLTAGLTAPITAFGVVSSKSAIDFEKSQGKMQAQLNLTKGEAKRLGEVARVVWKNGFGEDIQESTKSIGEIRQMMGDLSEKELQAVAEGAFTIRDAFDAEINETTRTASVLMKTFSIDGTKALDLITTGFQRGGDFTGELLDTLREYAPQFKGLGYNAEEFTAILVEGAESGAFNLDKIGDAAKEAFIRIGDGSKASRDALGDLGLDFEKIEEGINTGGEAAQTSFTAVVSALATIKDPAKRAQTAVSLIGTPLEDLGPEFQDFFAKVDTDLGKFEGATKRAGDALYDNVGDRAKQTFRDFQEDLLPVGEQLLDIADDVLPKVADSVKGVTGWFASLDEDGQKAVLTVAGLAAAAGPLLVIGGQLAVGIGGLMSVIGPLIPMIAGAGGLSAALGTAGGAVLAFATGPVGLAIAAIAGLTIAGIAFAKHMSKDAIPEVDRFGDQVSETTKESLGKFFELSDGVGVALSEMKLTGARVTDEMAEEMVGKYASMNDQIVQGMKTRHEEQLKTMSEFFANSSALTDEEEQKIIEKELSKNEKSLETQQYYLDKINEIYRTAAEENRSTTEQENEIIDTINKRMQDNAVTYLTESEVEQQIIMQRIKDTAGELSAQQAAEVVQRATEQKDGTIAAAEEQYENTLAEIIRMRDESGTISEEQATKLIADAKKTRDETVAHAESMHTDVVEQAKLQAGEHVDQVDWSTGKILSKWEVYKNGVVKKFHETNKNSMDDFKRWGNNIVDFSEEISKDALIMFGKFAAGMGPKFMTGAQSAMNVMGSMINGIVRGINWVLEKLDMKTLPLYKPVTLTSGSSKKTTTAIKAYAHGTDAHPGGWALVGDGIGDNAGPEYIRTPDGKHGFSPASNTLLDLPKGTTVLSAKETRKLFSSVPRYANGIGDTLSHIWDTGKDAWNTGKKKVFDIFDYLTEPKKLLDIGLAAAGFSIPSAGGFISEVVSGSLSKIKRGAVDHIKHALSDFSGSGGFGFGPSFSKTSSYGYRIHPILGIPQLHAGDDYGAPVGTPIPAQAAGRVTVSGYHPIRGNYVRIKSGILERIYQHNTRNLVETGDMVKQGQYIGTVGSTGRSTGPHLHYEVLRNGVNINPKGLATGGITNGFMVSSLHEEGYPEFVIPTAPNRRSDAMKLLALAYKKIGGGDNATRPDQLPDVAGNNDYMYKVIEKLTEQVHETKEIVSLLTKLLLKDSSVYIDGIALESYVSRTQKTNAKVRDLFVK